MGDSMSDKVGLIIERIMKDYNDKFQVDINSIEKLKSGWAGDIFMFALIDKNMDITNTQEFILKAYSKSSSGIENIRKESEALSYLGYKGYPVPKYIFSDLSCTKYDKPFIIMEKVNGKLFWDMYIEATSNEKELMMNKFAELLYELHQLDIPNSYISDENSSPTSLIDHELDEIKSLIDLYSINALGDIYKWLDEKKHRISNLKPSIIHRDYHPWNVIVGEHGETFVIDLVWGIGDFRFDLAWSVSLLERSGFQEVAYELFSSYERKVNKPIDNFEYFKVLATLRWLLNITISIYSGDNIRENEREKFLLFVKEPVEKALDIFEKITKIHVEFTL